MANYKFNPNKPGNFQWQSVDDGFLMVVDFGLQLSPMDVSFLT